MFKIIDLLKFDQEGENHPKRMIKTEDRQEKKCDLESMVPSFLDFIR